MTTDTHPATCPIGDGHRGPCPRLCQSCDGDGRCTECRGLDSPGCDACAGSGRCPDRCDDGTVQ